MPAVVLMCCWDFFMCSSGCKAMFYADSLITVKDGRIDRHEVFAPDEELAKWAACQQPG